MCRSKIQGGRRCPGGIGRAVKRQAVRLLAEAGPISQRQTAEYSTATTIGGLGKSLHIARQLRGAGVLADPVASVRSAYTDQVRRGRKLLGDKPMWRIPELNAPTAEWARDGWTVTIGGDAIKTPHTNRGAALAFAAGEFVDRHFPGETLTLDYGGPGDPEATAVTDEWEGDDDAYEREQRQRLAEEDWSRLQHTLQFAGVSIVELDREQFFAQRLSGEGADIVVRASRVTIAAGGDALSWKVGRFGATPRRGGRAGSVEESRRQAQEMIGRKIGGFGAADRLRIVIDPEYTQGVTGVADDMSKFTARAA